MRTIIYVDGYNFYYNLVYNTKYKWLDLGKFFDKILPNQCKIEKIKYFTAPMDDKARKKRQQAYFNALKHYMKYSFEDIEGYFKYDGAYSQHNKQFFIKNKNGEFEKAYKYTEKQTDVNLASHLVNDAYQKRYDCAVVVSNDSDIAGAIKLVKEYHPDKEVVCIPPIKEKSERNISQHLKDFAYFQCIEYILPPSISDILLEICQLPENIPDGGSKPQAWY